MKRIERVYQRVAKISQQLTPTDIVNGAGATTKQLALDLAIVRPNVSKALNDLVRQGQLAKIPGRPVRYVTPALAQRVTTEPAKPAPVRAKPAPVRQQTDFFDHMIGANGSLKIKLSRQKLRCCIHQRD